MASERPCRVLCGHRGDRTLIVALLILFNPAQIMSGDSASQVAAIFESYLAQARLLETVEFEMLYDKAGGLNHKPRHMRFVAARHRFRYEAPDVPFDDVPPPVESSGGGLRV